MNSVPTHICPYKETLPPSTICLKKGTSVEDVEDYVTAQMNDKNECEGNCTFAAVVRASELGPCPNGENQTEFKLLARISCIDLTPTPFVFKGKSTKELLDEILINLKSESQNLK